MTDVTSSDSTSAAATTSSEAERFGRSLAETFAEIGQQLVATTSVDGSMAALSQAGVRLVPGAEHAGVTQGRRGKFVSSGATGELALQVDAIQYQLTSGPCVDAILDQTAFRTGNLASDARWPEFGRRAAGATGVHSMLAVRMYLEVDDLLAGLNLYATEPDAFTAADETTAILLATHGALALTGAIEHERADGMATALQSNRSIGVAIGVLMTRLLITRVQAFDLLRVSSQHTNRKLSELALDVIDTGTLPIPPHHT